MGLPNGGLTPEVGASRVVSALVDAAQAHPTPTGMYTQAYCQRVAEVRDGIGIVEQQLGNPDCAADGFELVGYVPAFLRGVFESRYGNRSDPIPVTYLRPDPAVLSERLFLPRLGDRLNFREAVVNPLIFAITAIQDGPGKGRDMTWGEWALVGSGALFMMWTMAMLAATTAL